MREEGNSQQLVISITGFGDESKNFEAKLKELGGCFEDTLRDKTRVLVANKVNTEKYKIARLMKPSPYIVTDKWLKDSILRGRFEEYSKHQVQDIFHGIVVGMYGYKQLQLDILLKNFKGREKHFVEVTSIEKPHLDEQDVDVVVMHPSEYRRHHQPFDCSAPPIVCQEWLEKSLQQGVCLWPEDYAYNKDSFHHTQVITSLANYIEINKATISMQTNEKDNTLLEGVIIYIHNFGDRDKQRIQHIVHEGGGWVLPVLIDQVTHIIPNCFNQVEYSTFTKFGNIIEVVRLAWVMDCVRTKQRLKVDDYRFRRNKFQLNQDGVIANQKYDSAVKEPPQDNNASMNFSAHSNGYQKQQSLPAMYMRKSLSVSYVDKQRSALKPRLKTSLTDYFKGQDFCVLKAHIHREQIRRITKLIRENGGTVYEGVSSKLRIVYLVMADDPQNGKLLQQFDRYQEIVRPVSHRWVNYCISKKMFVDPTKQGYFTFRPFRMGTPLPELLKCKFAVLGFNDVLKQRIYELLEVVGHRPVENFINQVTHAICEPNYKEREEKSRIYRQLQQNNKQVKYVKLNWIMDSVNGGKLMPVQQYLMA